MRGFRALLVGGLLALALAGCDQDEQVREGRQEPPGMGTEEGQRAAAERTRSTTFGETAIAQATQGAKSGGEVVVGGFSVEGLGSVPETTVPRVSVEPEAARTYLHQVEPIIEGTTRDVSDLVEPEVRVENGRLEVDLGLDSLRDGRDDVRRGLEKLREVRPPQDLQPINERLISAYEEALPAYDNVIKAAESGDPGRVREAIQRNLPRIERFNDLTKGIIQDLEQSAGTGQEHPVER